MKKSTIEVLEVVNDSMIKATSDAYKAMIVYSLFAVATGVMATLGKRKNEKKKGEEK